MIAFFMRWSIFTFLSIQTVISLRMKNAEVRLFCTFLTEQVIVKIANKVSILKFCESHKNQ